MEPFVGVVVLGPGPFSICLKNSILDPKNSISKGPKSVCLFFSYGLKKDNPGLDVIACGRSAGRGSLYNVHTPMSALHARYRTQRVACQKQDLGSTYYIVLG